MMACREETAKLLRLPRKLNCQEKEMARELGRTSAAGMSPRAEEKWSSRAEETWSSRAEEKWLARGGAAERLIGRKVCMLRPEMASCASPVMPA